VSADIVRVERSHDGDVAEGAVRPGAGGNAGISAIAAARAWATLGRRRLAAGDPDGAIACASAGLEEIDGLPIDDGVKDDTGLKLEAARERVREGHPSDGAEVMLDVLDARSELRAQAVGATLVA
jgi:hypothetical protein